MTRFKKCDNEFCNNVIKPPYNILYLSSPDLGGHKKKVDVGYGTLSIVNRRKKLRLCTICHEAELDAMKEQGGATFFPDAEQKIIADEKVGAIKKK